MAIAAVGTTPILIENLSGIQKELLGKLGKWKFLNTQSIQIDSSSTGESTPLNLAYKELHDCTLRVYNLYYESRSNLLFLQEACEKQDPPALEAPADMTAIQGISCQQLIKQQEAFIQQITPYGNLLDNLRDLEEKRENNGTGNESIDVQTCTQLSEFIEKIDEVRAQKRKWISYSHQLTGACEKQTAALKAFLECVMDFLPLKLQIDKAIL